MQTFDLVDDELRFIASVLRREEYGRYRHDVGRRNQRRVFVHHAVGQAENCRVAPIVEREFVHRRDLAQLFHCSECAAKAVNLLPTVSGDTKIFRLRRHDLQKLELGGIDILSLIDLNEVIATLPVVQQSCMFLQSFRRKYDHRVECHRVRLFEHGEKLLADAQCRPRRARNSVQRTDDFGDRCFGSPD